MTPWQIHFILQKICFSNGGLARNTFDVLRSEKKIKSILVYFSIEDCAFYIWKKGGNYSCTMRNVFRAFRSLIKYSFWHKYITKLRCSQHSRSFSLFLFFSLSFFFSLPLSLSLSRKCRGFLLRFFHWSFFFCKLKRFAHFNLF